MWSAPTISLEDPSGLAYATNYTYDVLDHLTRVQQTRVDPRLLIAIAFVEGKSATNPENGTVSYTYNSDGTLATKTDARNQQVSYAYDSYKRLTRINRGGGQNVALYYDTNPFDSQFTQNALGRLAAVQYQANSPHTFVEMYSYTAAGKLAGKQLQISYNCLWWNSGNGNPCNAAQVFALNGYGTYDNEGRMTAQTWPQDQAGRNPSVSYGYDAMGRPNTLTETQNGNQYNAVTGVTYNAANQPLSYGSETWTYNVLGQITSHQAGTWLSVQYGYATGQDNGKIASRTNVLSGEQVVYTYDSLNRLIQAQTAPNANVPQWGQGFVYDGFGNLLQKNVTAGSAPTLTVTVDSGNHVIASGMTYDAAGNPTQMYLDPGYSSTPAPLSWDADSRLVGVGSGGPSGSNLDLYGYDAGNHRVWHRNWLSDMFFFYGVDGHRIGTYTWDGTDTLLTLERSAGPEIYFRGRLQSTYAAQDQVGSTGGGGSYPYGESYASPDPGRMVGFATYTRDQTGLDYAHNRYYFSTLGRFLSADPYVNGAGLGDPQGWNRYAYTGGDPVNRLDPFGLYYCAPPDDDVPVPGCSYPTYGVWGGDDFAYWTMYTEEATILGNTEENGGGGSSGGSGPFPKCNPNNTAIKTNNLQFVKTNYSAAMAVSEGSGVPIDWILGWAAFESSLTSPEGNYYGTVPQAQSGYNNFFGETASGWNGQITCPTPTISNSNGSTFACFASFQGSASAALFSFNGKYGNILSAGAANGDTATEAFQQVYDAGWNGGNASIIGSVVGRVASMLNCLFMNNYM